jgi:hypothetical protein
VRPKPLDSQQTIDLAEFEFFNQRILGKTILFPLIKEYISPIANRVTSFIVPDAMPFFSRPRDTFTPFSLQFALFSCEFQKIFVPLRPILVISILESTRKPTCAKKCNS